MYSTVTHISFMKMGDNKQQNVLYVANTEMAEQYYNAPYLFLSSG